MPSTSKIKPILDHIAWLENALRDSDTPETPYRKALLALNAATLLDWHSTLPSQNARKKPAKPSAHKKLEKLIAGFTNATKKSVSKTKGLTSTNAEKPLDTLADEAAGFLKKATKLLELEVTPRREPEFEKPLRPAELISQWLEGNKRLKSSKASGAKAVSPMAGKGAYAIHSLLPVFAAQNLFESGRLTAEEFTIVRQTCEGYLNDAIEIAASGGSAAERRKWRALGRPVAEALRRPVDARSRMAGK
jgi:hypothetical protein